MRTIEGGGGAIPKEEEITSERSGQDVGREEDSDRIDSTRRWDDLEWKKKEANVLGRGSLWRLHGE